MSDISTLRQLNNEFQVLSVSGKRWMFRGQSADWKLAPTLERALDRFEFSIQKELRRWEWRLLRHFRRNFHRYSVYRPTEHDTVHLPIGYGNKLDKLEWLTIMQHHGAPTRLLDWNYSPHVALFFAIESAKTNSKCVVWAAENEFLDTETRKRLSPRHRDIYRDTNHDGDKSPEVLNALLEAEADHIVPLNPFRLTERLAIQQGVFLASQSTREPFVTIFEKMRTRKPAAFRKFEIVCSKQFLKDVLSELHSMNISRASLFPGLDGFSRSFENLLAHQTLWNFLK